MKRSKKKWFLKRMLSVVLLLYFLKVLYGAFAPETEAFSIGQMILKQGYEESGAKNSVTAIYLDYRLYDTFFEALILMISVSGVALLSENKREEKNR